MPLYVLVFYRLHFITKVREAIFCSDMDLRCKSLRYHRNRKDSTEGRAHEPLLASAPISLGLVSKKLRLSDKYRNHRIFSTNSIGTANIHIHTDKGHLKM